MQQLAMHQKISSHCRGCEAMAAAVGQGQGDSSLQALVRGQRELGRII